MSGFWVSSSAGAEPSAAFLILASLTVGGRKSAGAAAITTASAEPAAASDRVAQLLGGLDPDHLDAGRVGQRDVGGDQGDLGAAGGGGAGQRVALQARGAVAEEAHRVEVLAGAAGGDHDAGGRPGRALAAPPRASTSAQTSKISSGSGSRPLPVSAPVSRPSAGSMTRAPRSRRVATLAWVAGCSHISVCIAGANTTGQRAVSRVLVSRSSARPWAALASRSAVAGRDHDQVGRLADPDVRHLVDVGPDVGGDRLAGQRRPGGGADELQRGGGRDDGHVVAGLGEPAQQLAGLVGRDAAGDPENDARPRPVAGRRPRRRSVMDSGVGQLGR